MKPTVEIPAGYAPVPRGKMQSGDRVWNPVRSRWMEIPAEYGRIDAKIFEPGVLIIRNSEAALARIPEAAK